MARGKLVVFSPHTDLTCYMPNVGLATLAGSLLDNGHSVTIEDYGTVTEIERLAPAELKKRLAAIYPVLLEGGTAERRLALQELEGILGRIDEEHMRRTHETAERLLDECEKEHVDFIGFQGWMGQGMTDTLYAAEYVRRRRPGTKIFLGGATVDQVRVAIYGRTGAFDALAVGDGDETIVELARFSEGKGKLGSIPNIIYRDGGETVETERVFVKDLDTLPMPVYDGHVYPAMEADGGKIKIGVLDDSRGCPNRCYFCPHNEKSGNRWRIKSPERMAGEVKNLGKYGMTHWRKAGSNPPLESGLEEAGLYLKEGLGTFWTAFGSMGQFGPGSRGDFETLRKAGLLALSFGIEHGDPDMRRKYFNKKIGGNERIRGVLRSVMSSGIYCVGSFIYPAPFETEESARKTLEFVLEAFSDREASSAQFYPPGLFPQSGWGREPERFGFAVDREVEYPAGYALEAMEFVLNRRLPPGLWRRSMPYSLNGKPFRSILEETHEFCGRLKGAVALNIPEEYVLFWHALAEKGLSVEDFSDTASRAVYTMDCETMKGLALRINENSGSMQP